MKKKLLAAAVVGALASPAAFAQTLYGLIDIGYQRADHGGDGAENFIQSGQHSGSRFGVRGSEDLAGGLYAMYQIEFNILADTGGPGATDTTRLTFAGLGNKAWGELTLGRQYTHTFHTFAVGSSIGYGTFATMYTNTGIATRASNSIKYSSPNFNGFTVGALWAPGESSDSDNDGNYFDVAVRWTPGPFGVAVSHAVQEVENPAATVLGVAGVPLDGEITHTQVAANWNAGAWGIYGAFQKRKDDSPGFDFDADIWHVNAVFRFGGRHEIHGLFGRVEEDVDALGLDGEADVWGIVYQHLFSKRTRIYAGYGQADNEDGLIIPRALAGTTATNVAGVKPAFLAGPAFPEDDKPSGFQIGLLHTF